MGKRKRSLGQGKRKERKPQTATERPKQSNEAEEPITADIDEHCVQYESPSEDEKLTNQEERLEDNGKVSASSDDSAEEDSSEEDDEAAEIQLENAADDESDVQVDLEFFDPTDDDITPIAAFLDEYTFNVVGRTKEDGAKKPKVVNSRALSEAVCKQTRVGTTVRVSNEKTPIGFISCLNVYEHRELLKPIKKYILEQCGGKSEFERVEQLIKKSFESRGNYESQRMGLILTERVVNLPPQIVPKMLEALFCEIEWAVEDEPTVEQRESFRLGWYLYLTEVYMRDGTKLDVQTGSGKENGKSKVKKLKVDGGVDEDEGISFTRPEDEAWWTYAAHKLTWSVKGEEKGKGGVDRKRMCMIIAGSKIKNVREMVESMIGIEDLEMDGSDEADGNSK